MYVCIYIYIYIYIQRFLHNFMYLLFSVALSLSRSLFLYRVYPCNQMQSCTNLSSDSQIFSIISIHIHIYVCIYVIFLCTYVCMLYVCIFVYKVLQIAICLHFVLHSSLSNLNCLLTAQFMHLPFLFTYCPLNNISLHFVLYLCSFPIYHLTLNLNINVHSWLFLLILLMNFLIASVYNCFGNFVFLLLLLLIMHLLKRTLALVFKCFCVFIL